MIYSLAKRPCCLALPLRWRWHALKAADADRMAAVTCTIVMLVPPVGSPERMFAARLIEVGWGILAALALVWAAARFYPATSHENEDNTAVGSRAFGAPSTK